MRGPVSRIKYLRLRAALRLYDAAADKFIAKVESGRARSVETYNDLRTARAVSRGVK